METCMRPFTRQEIKSVVTEGESRETRITGRGKLQFTSYLHELKPFQKTRYPHQQYKSLLNSLSKAKCKQEKIHKLSVGRVIREPCCYSTE